MALSCLLNVTPPRREFSIYILRWNERNPSIQNVLCMSPDTSQDGPRGVEPVAEWVSRADPGTAPLAEEHGDETASCGSCSEFDQPEQIQ